MTHPFQTLFPPFFGPSVATAWALETLGVSTSFPYVWKYKSGYDCCRSLTVIKCMGCCFFFFFHRFRQSQYREVFLAHSVVSTENSIKGLWLRSSSGMVGTDLLPRQADTRMQHTKIGFLQTNLKQTFTLASLLPWVWRLNIILLPASHSKRSQCRILTHCSSNIRWG